MKKWTLIVVGTLVALVAAVLLIGSVLPEEHTASRTARYDVPPERIWETITDFENGPSWRSNIHDVERLRDRDGNPVWREDGDFGPMALEVVEQRPPRRLVTRIADEGLPFGGTWTYEIEPEGDGTRLTITEDGFISNVLFRFMSRFVFGYTGTMETYLVDLGRAFGQEVQPRAPGQNG